MTGRRSTHSGRAWRRWRKAARWVALGAALPALWACNARRLEAPQATPTRVEMNTFQQTLNRDVDILFMIDNSLSMRPLQTKLATNFPAFMQVLTGLPGGLPNVHIAVVSSDMGAGGEPTGMVQHCALGGDQGIFQVQPRGTCTGSGLQAGQNFISNIAGQANYTGTIENVFSCIAQLGDQGCGFEHQLASVARALGADNNNGTPQMPNPQPPAENANFLRPNAFLSIVLITNEDDCSAPPNSGLFDPGSRYVSDQLGPLTSFRCNDFGHLCGMPAARPPRDQDIVFPPQGQPGACTPALGPPSDQGQLIPVQTFVDQIKALKRDPSKVLVAAVAGPPDGPTGNAYHITQVPSQQGDPAPTWPQIDHSCNQADGTYGDPSIRLKAFIDGFGSRGLFQSICAASFAPALQLIAREIGKVLGPSCVEGTLVDTGNGPDCTVTDHAFNDQGVDVPSIVPSCASIQGGCTNGTTSTSCTTCWQLVPGGGTPTTCNNDQIMQVNRPMGTMPTSELNSTVACALCIPGVMQAGCP
jgi:hypothetical protein